VYLSPLHGAVLAGTIGNHGVAVEPHLVASVEKNGTLVASPTPGEQRIVAASTADALVEMMERTVTEGTARKWFRGRKGKSIVGPVKVAGKTGSLSDHPPLPFKDYSWFVGFAPAEAPTVAVAAVVVNGLRWRVKAPFLAREALRTYFNEDLGHRKHAER
jgi:cell division protein FtsI/penicillin-binding protein 2